MDYRDAQSGNSSQKEPSSSPSDSMVGARKSRPTIVIVGNGMIGQRCCEELRARKALAHHRIVIFGEEAHSAYDRVHLARILQGGSVGELALVDHDWHGRNRIRVVRQDPVVKLEPEKKRLRCFSGNYQEYDHLILATGATAIRGNLPGANSRDVQVLRTADDAENLLRLARQALQNGLPAVVIGGGLLGLEVASELLALGLEVITLESAGHPLARQLDPEAGERLATLLNHRQFGLKTSVRIEGIEQQELGSLVKLEGAPSIRCGLVVPAMGIRPRDQLAREAGIACDLFGGVIVNDALLTSDPNISAVGECARHRGMTYGLVAPGYAMAEAVARRLAGSVSPFESVQVGTRLKVADLKLTVVGESAATGLGMHAHLFSHDDTYRRLAVQRGRIIGVTALGDWEELGQVQEAMARGERLRPFQLKHFERGEAMWKGKRLSLRTWPDAATVCTCLGVTCGTLKRAHEAGCVSVEALAEKTGASTVCGTCRPLLATLSEDTEIRPTESPWMLRLSVLSALGALAIILLPRIPVPESVLENGIGRLFTDSVLKQVTGFSTLALFSASILFSMRKRLSWLNWGDFENWRIVHAALGLLCLGGAVAHTGLRLGQRLDLALMLTVLGSCFLGGLAGGWRLLEEHLSAHRAAALRATLIRSHIYLLWPLPVLLIVHIGKVYFF